MTSSLDLGQKRVATPGQQKWYHLFGAYNWRSDEVIFLPAAKKNSATFCSFIEHLMQSVPTDKPVVIVLDNASYHHSAVSEAMLAYYEDRSLVVWLPPYCSDLNPIEPFWLHLKQSACGFGRTAAVEGVGRNEARHLYAIHNDTVCHFWVLPMEPTMREAAWQMALDSFTFLR